MVVNSEKAKIINNIIALAKTESLKGNKSVDLEKLNRLALIVDQSKLQPKPDQLYALRSLPSPPTLDMEDGSVTSNSDDDSKLLIVRDIVHPPQNTVMPAFSPLHRKFNLDQYFRQHPYNNVSSNYSRPIRKEPGQVPNLSNYVGFKKLETHLINSLETMTSILDNLNLVSRFGLFKDFNTLHRLVKHTNKLWLITLIFMVRKLGSELLYNLHRARLLEKELAVIRSDLDNNTFDDLIITKYELLIEDLRNERNLMAWELFGNIIDLIFVVVELRRMSIPKWLSHFLSIISGLMSIYRMNKISGNEEKE